ncbi:MAG: M20/M25/M40 family metallo-hydrolase [Acidobacteriota bacterium]
MSGRSRIARLLHDLVDVPSVSGEEEAASRFLVGEMRDLGFDRAFVDDVGNAVGEIGSPEAARTVVLLGHIDTVPGDIAVRFEGSGDEEVLRGRGTVDAKGPLATFAVATSAVDRDLLRRADARFIVAGAVEEESATSRGARALRDRFDGVREPKPDACVIGEPSRFDRVTLGYKGRVLLEARAENELAHTAGPDPGIAVQLVELWNLLEAASAKASPDEARAFDQVQPSLRSLRSGLEDGFVSWAEASFGVRLPTGFDLDSFLSGVLEDWTAVAARREQVDAPPTPQLTLAQEAASLRWQVGERSLELRAHGYEPAWRSGRANELVRSFQRSIRAAGHRPGFVVKTGTSDMNVVGPAWQCPILAYGPGDSSLDHTPHEHVFVRELEQAVEVLTGALEVLLEGWSPE